MSTLARWAATSSTSVGVARQPRVVDEVLLDQHRAQRRQAPGVGARAHLEVEVGQVGGLGAPRVEHDHRAGRVAGDLLQRGAGAGDAVALPRVLADEERDLGLLEVAAHVGAEHLAVDPELARLLLGERVGPEPRAHGRPGAGRVGAAEVVPLPAAAVVEDRLPAVGVAHLGEPGRHLGDGGVPVDLLEGAVVAAAQRGRQAVATVLVVVEAQRLLARVARPTRGGPCRRGCARSGDRRHRRGAPRCRSCTRRGCRPSGARCRRSRRRLLVGSLEESTIEAGRRQPRCGRSPADDGHAGGRRWSAAGPGRARRRRGGAGTTPAHTGRSMSSSSSMGPPVRTLADPSSMSQPQHQRGAQLGGVGGAGHRAAAGEHVLDDRVEGVPLGRLVLHLRGLCRGAPPSGSSSSGGTPSGRARARRAA